MLEELAQIVIVYLAKSLLEELKKSSIFMLRKKKKDYLILKAYRPIALENISVKLVKKILIIYIAEKLETEILPLSN